MTDPLSLIDDVNIFSSVIDNKRKELAEASTLKHASFSMPVESKPIPDLSPLAHQIPSLNSLDLLQTNANLSYEADGFINNATDIYGSFTQGAAELIFNAPLSTPNIFAEAISKTAQSNLGADTYKKAASILSPVTKTIEIMDIMGDKVVEKTAKLWGNDVAIAKAEQQLRSYAKEAEGGYDLLAGIVNTAVDNPLALSQVTAQSLPQMYGLAQKGLPFYTTFVGMVGQRIEASTEKYAKKFNKLPEGKAYAFIVSTSMAATAIEALESKFLLSKLQPTSSIVSKALSKIPAGRTAGAVAGGGTAEFIQEGSGVLLEELGGQQDLAALTDPKVLTDAYVAGGLGAGSGAGIKGARQVIPDTAKVLVDSGKLAKKGLDNFSEYVEDAVTTNSAKAYAKAVEKEDYVKAANTLLHRDITAYSKEDRVTHIKTLFDVSDKLAEQIQNTDDQKLVDKYTKAYTSLSDKITLLIAKDKELQAQEEDSLTLDKAEQIIRENTEETTVQEIDASVNKVVATILSGSDVDKKTITSIKGSDFFKELDIKDQEIVEKYDEHLSTIATLQSVNSDIFKGNVERKFYGIKQHKQHIAQAIETDNYKLAEITLKQLAKLRDSQVAKLDNKDNKEIFIRIVKSEIQGLDSTISIMNDVVLNKFEKTPLSKADLTPFIKDKPVTPKVTPTPKTTAKPKKPSKDINTEKLRVFQKIKTIPDADTRKTLVSELNKVKTIADIEALETKVDEALGKRESKPTEAAEKPSKEAKAETTKVEKVTPVHYGKNLNQVLSNFSKTSLKYKGKVFNTVEGAYQAFKSGNYIKGFENLTGTQAKTKGQNIKVDTATNIQLMEELLQARYMQDSDFQDALLKSDTITHPVNDKFWAKEFARILEELKINKPTKPVKQEFSTPLPVNTEVDDNTPTKYELFKNSGVYANKDQTVAIDKIKAWWKNKQKEVFVLAGRGGTGKTTVIGKAIEETGIGKSQVMFVLPTHKAKGVIKDATDDSYQNFTTVASILGMRPAKAEEKKVRAGEIKPDFIQDEDLYDSSKEKIEDLGIKLLVLDESSLLNKENADLLLYFAEELKIRIIFMGDNVQSPPIVSGQDKNTLRISPVFSALSGFDNPLLADIDETNTTTLIKRMRQKGESPILTITDVIADAVLYIFDSIKNKKPFVGVDRFPNIILEGKDIHTEDGTVEYKHDPINKVIDSFVKEYNKDKYGTKWVNFNKAAHGITKELTSKIRAKLFPDIPNAGNLNEVPYIVGEHLMIGDTSFVYDETGKPKTGVLHNGDEVVVVGEPIETTITVTDDFRHKALRRIPAYKLPVNIARKAEDKPIIRHILVKSSETEEAIFSRMTEGQQKYPKLAENLLLSHTTALGAAYIINTDKAQGSTYTTVYADYGNITGTTNSGVWVDILRSLYVATSRPTTKLVMVGKKLELGKGEILNNLVNVPQPEAVIPEIVSTNFKSSQSQYDVNKELTTDELAAIAGSTLGQLNPVMKSITDESVTGNVKPMGDALGSLDTLEDGKFVINVNSDIGKPAIVQRFSYFRDVLTNVSLAEKVVLHEVGHILDAVADTGKLKSDQLTGEFINSLDKESAGYDTWIKPYVHGHNLDTQKKELFANSFAWFMLNPKQMQTSQPRLYNYIKSTYDGLSRTSTESTGSKTETESHTERSTSSTETGETTPTSETETQEQKELLRTFNISGKDVEVAFVDRIKDTNHLASTNPDTGKIQVVKGLTKEKILEHVQGKLPGFSSKQKEVVNATMLENFGFDLYAFLSGLSRNDLVMFIIAHEVGHTRQKDLKAKYFSDANQTLAQKYGLEDKANKLLADSAINLEVGANRYALQTLNQTTERVSEPVIPDNIVADIPLKTLELFKSFLELKLPEDKDYKNDEKNNFDTILFNGSSGRYFMKYNDNIIRAIQDIIRGCNG